MLPHCSPYQIRGLALTGLLLLAGSVGPLAHPQPVHASDAAGIYTLVEDIALEADPARPDDKVRIRIYGVHALSYRPQAGEQRGRGIYTDPAEGYLYFACRPADAATCRLEWQDLMKAIGDDRCAIFGDRYLSDPEPNGRLRPAGEAPANPDTYPVGQGVLMVREGDRSVCQDLRKFAAARGAPSPAPSAAPSTGSPPTDAPPTDPPPSPTEKPQATEAPEAKPSPGSGHALPAGALLLPRLQPDRPGGVMHSPALGHSDGDHPRVAAYAAAGTTRHRPGDGPLGTAAMLVLGFLTLGLVMTREGRRRP